MPATGEPGTVKPMAYAAKTMNVKLRILSLSFECSLRADDNVGYPTDGEENRRADPVTCSLCSRASKSMIVNVDKYARGNIQIDGQNSCQTKSVFKLKSTHFSTPFFNRQPVKRYYS